MQDITTTTFKGQGITVTELTVKQIRETFDRISNESSLFIDEVLDQPVPALIVCQSTGLTIDQLEEAKPSDLLPLCREVLQVNPSLASMIQRRVDAVNRMEQLIRSKETLTGQSAT